MILFKKEKEVIELILQHVDKVEECIKVGVTTLQTYLKDDIQNAKKLARETDWPALFVSYEKLLKYRASFIGEIAAFLNVDIDERRMEDILPFLEPGSYKT